MLDFENSIAQTSEGNNNSKYQYISASLTDDSKIEGFVLNQTDSTFIVLDFGLGEIGVLKRTIESSSIKEIEGEVKIELLNSNEYFGSITKIEGGIIYLKTELLGMVQIISTNIARIVSNKDYISGKRKWFANPNATRYFFAPSAVPLKKKEGYFQNAYLLANSVSYGLTNNITIGGGVVIPLLFYVTPKISYKVGKNLYAGGGILFTQSFISSMGLSAGIGYGLVTYGNLEHNITIGAGYGMATFDKKYRNTPMPIITVNGMSRVSKKISLISENWLIPRAGYNKEVITIDSSGYENYNSLYINENFYSVACSGGVRIMPSLKTSIDFGVVGIVNMKNNTSNLFIPYLDVVYKFN